MDRIVLYGTALLAVALTLAFLSSQDGLGILTGGGVVILIGLVAAVTGVVVILRRKL